MRSAKILTITTISALILSTKVLASTLTIPMYLVADKGPGKPIGTIALEDHAGGGVLLTPDLHDLSPGVHGIHIHENPSCDDNGKAAGGHVDPNHSGRHEGPYNDRGHLGDLPVLVVGKDGKSTLPMLAPKFTLQKLSNHSIIIHAGGDNYSDSPEKLGGGGARIACGIIPS